MFALNNTEFEAVKECAMEFAIESGERWGDEVRRLLLAQGKMAKTYLTEPGDDPFKAAHEARKAFKRMRALLQTVRPTIGEKAFQKVNGRLRLLGNKLAPVREAGAMLEMMDSLKESWDQPPAAFKAAYKKLEKQRTKVLTTLIHKKNVLGSVAVKLEKTLTDIERLKLEAAGFKVVKKGLKRVYEQGQRRMKAAYRQKNQPEAFHHWRKRVKNMWHQLEILTPVKPKKLGVYAEEAHQLADFLGDAHDLAELRHLLKQAKPKGKDKKLTAFLKILKKRQADCEEAARPLGKRLYKRSSAEYVARLEKWVRDFRPQTTDDRLQTSDHRLQTTEGKGEKKKGRGLKKPEAVEPPAEIQAAVVEETAPQLLTTREAAEQLNITIPEVRQMIYDGALAAEKVRGRWLVNSSSIINNQ